MSKPEVPFATHAQQAEASDPQNSSWVSANAGSGKTYVLTMRVIRLLLNGVDPTQILCLTYTKVAAANMASRIFNTLARWTQLDDQSLIAEIENLGQTIPIEQKEQANLLHTARCLFAEAVETPGGLKIQTIHAFCERLLHLFPFEANVSAAFSVIEDEEQTLSLQKAQDHVLTFPETDEIRAAIDFLAQEVSEDGLTELMKKALSQRQAFEDMRLSTPTIQALSHALNTHLGLSADARLSTLREELLTGGLSPTDILTLYQELESLPIANRLLHFLEAKDTPAAFDTYKSIFLTQSDTPLQRGFLATKDKTAHPRAAERLSQEQARIAALIEPMRAAAIVERSLALAIVVDAILQRYRQINARRSKLDFDDLIGKTLTLISGPTSAWVLFKLDQGIDHILVDEAQDTSPPQWKLFSALAEEFFSGQGQRHKARSFFAVGDEKQSIYSFQGAAPQLFAQNRDEFGKKIRNAEKKFSAVTLDLSFRSSPLILEFVDQVFASPQNASGLSFGAGSKPASHRALHRSLPGLVEIWPLPETIKESEQENWRLPLDTLQAQDPKVQLAEQIAEQIARWLRPDSTDCLTDKSTKKTRPIRAGDILVLVRSRNPFLLALNRALKQRNVPVAGADRLKLNEHIAVLDLLAVGRIATLPLDDYSLACVLKSPLFECDDKDLITLAPQRKGSLLNALKQGSPVHQAAADRIQTWQHLAQDLSPFAFYMRILGNEGGRKALLSRLGPEAADILDEFLSAALTHEARGAASLIRFVAEMETSERPIKRDLDQAGDMVRVMTVHAAKGLEAKIVFLPDTGTLPDYKKSSKFFSLAQDAHLNAPPFIVWSARKEEDCQVVAKARDAALERDFQEHRRLLYVAMTRAEERLYICGFHSPKPQKQEKPGLNWYDMVNTAVEHMQPHPAFWDEARIVLRTEQGATRADSLTRDPVPSLSAIPVWLHRPAAVEASLPAPIRPSQSLTAADQNEPEPIGRARGLLRGTLTHNLLEHLPAIAPALRAQNAQTYLEQKGAALSPMERAELKDRVLNVLSHPDLAELFGETGRAEVPICGEIRASNGTFLPVMGRIDRLLVTQDMVLIADFKTGKRQTSYVGQMALYKALLEQIYPTVNIKAILIWTDELSVEWLEDAALQTALDQITVQGSSSL
jgi:ATP-dependent helicase/nuclease subunit A